MANVKTHVSRQQAAYFISHLSTQCNTMPAIHINAKGRKIVGNPANQAGSNNHRKLMRLKK
jgi:hypothetical protein